MKNNTVVPFPGTHKPIRIVNLSAINTRTERLYPGVIKPVTHDLYIGIEYDQADNQYIPRFKFYSHGAEIKDQYLDENRQLDLRKACRCIITLIAHRMHSTMRSRPTSTIIEIAHVPYSWEI